MQLIGDNTRGLAIGEDGKTSLGRKYRTTIYNTEFGGGFLNHDNTIKAIFHYAPQGDAMALTTDGKKWKITDLCPWDKFDDGISSRWWMCFGPENDIFCYGFINNGGVYTHYLNRGVTGEADPTTLKWQEAEEVNLLDPLNPGETFEPGWVSCGNLSGIVAHSLESTGSHVWHSPDGINFSRVLSLPGDTFQGGAWRNGIFIIMTSYYLYTSPDGINWTQVFDVSNHGWSEMELEWPDWSMNQDAFLYTLHTAKKGWLVAVGFTMPGWQPGILHSTDGVTWGVAIPTGSSSEQFPTVVDCVDVNGQDQFVVNSTYQGIIFGADDFEGSWGVISPNSGAQYGREWLYSTGNGVLVDNRYSINGIPADQIFYINNFAPQPVVPSRLSIIVENKWDPEDESITSYSPVYTKRWENDRRFSSFNGVVTIWEDKINDSTNAWLVVPIGNSYGFRSLIPGRDIISTLDADDNTISIYDSGYIDASRGIGPGFWSSRVQPSNYPQLIGRGNLTYSASYGADGYISGRSTIVGHYNNIFGGRSGQTIDIYGEENNIIGSYGASTNKYIEGSGNTIIGGDNYQTIEANHSALFLAGNSSIQSGGNENYRPSRCHIIGGYNNEIETYYGGSGTQQVTQIVCNGYLVNSYTLALVHVPGWGLYFTINTTTESYAVWSYYRGNLWVINWLLITPNWALMQYHPAMYTWSSNPNIAGKTMVMATVYDDTVTEYPALGGQTPTWSLLGAQQGMVIPYYQLPASGVAQGVANALNSIGSGSVFSAVAVGDTVTVTNIVPGYVTPATAGTTSFVVTTPTVGAAGETNTPSYTLISGGYNNKISGGQYSSIVGSRNASIETCDYSTIAGGSGAQLVKNYQALPDYGHGQWVLGAGWSTTNSPNNNYFRVDLKTIPGKCFADGGYASSGADYAEMFEWEDENPNDEDRVGYFVEMTPNGKIKIATGNNILGVVSASGSVVANVSPSYWSGMFNRDDFGRILMDTYDVYLINNEDVYVKQNTGEVYKYYAEPGRKAEPSDASIAGLTPYRTLTVHSINENHDPSAEYVSRENRKEWSPIGLIGQIRVRTESEVEVGDIVNSSQNGMAKKTDGNGYQVINVNKQKGGNEYGVATIFIK